MSAGSILGRIAAAVWAVITRLRQVLANLLFLALLAGIVLLLVGQAPTPIAAPTALLLNPGGRIVDQKSPVEPLQRLLGVPSPLEQEVLLRDVLDAIHFAAGDPAISALVMELDYLVAAGISNVQAIASALTVFKATGKPVLAVGDFFSQDQYLLASHADEVILHPMGAVALEGFSSYRNYYRDALDKLSVSMHVFKAGEHKSMAEPFVRDDMSGAEREITRRWLEDLWSQYTGMLEGQRGLAGGEVDDYVNNYARHLAERGGDAAATALARNLVDQLLNRDEANDYLSQRVGAQDDEGLYQAVAFEDYLLQVRDPEPFAPGASRVAVLTAQGDILPGDQAPGAIGGDSLAWLIRSTAEQAGVEAIVLRINSGGGSVFASEIIRNELARVRAAGVPLVVSMGTVAASGGYYIAAGADQVWATPATITGSIGVFAAFPTFERLLARGGIYTDGVGTTALAGALRVDRPLNPELAAVLTSTVDHTYRDFLELVADGRGMTVEAVDAVAQGRVWSAGDALAHGLVDRLGYLDDAIEAAAGLAHLSGYAVEYVDFPTSTGNLLLERLLDRLEWLPAGHLPAALPGSVWQGMLESVGRAASELSGLSDPGHLYMRCLACSVLNR
jgi:protease-4